MMLSLMRGYSSMYGSICGDSNSFRSPGSCSVLLDHVNLIIEMPHEIPVWPNLPFICYSYTYLHLLVLAPMPVLTEWSLRVLHFF